MNTVSTTLKKKRTYLPESLTIDNWNTIEPYFKELSERSIKNKVELKKWLADRSELDAVLEEDMAWRYIRMNIDTTSKELAESFNFFVEEIEPKIAPISNELNKKLSKITFLNELGSDYDVTLRDLKTSLKLFREENIPISSKIQIEAQKYGSTCAKMSIELDGKEITMQKAQLFLKENDRSKREAVYLKLEERRQQDANYLQELFDDLKKLRTSIAKNTNHKNFRDYKFEAMCRFDYTADDCFEFHNAVQKNITPIVNNFALERKNALGYENLKPWDNEVDTTGKPPLKPFKNANELVEKTIQSFYNIDQSFGDCVSLMRDNGHLDLDSKKGKAPGGFNYPLFESGLPFIYMNSVGSLRDLVTMMHEGGHAVHSYLTKDLEITDFKSFPSEVAELASMSMELISMDQWGLFFEDEEELKRAKKEHLKKVIGVLPWIAAVDKFQHWLYENENNTAEERDEKWLNIISKFSSDVTDWSGLEKYRKQSWLKQLHIFEVPFYYIEYGFAQLGAIAVWKNYKQDPSLAIQKYKNALSLGNTATIPEIYEAAGVSFKFNESYVKELADFIIEEINQL